ncbi:MAG: hypothetical protein CMJ95_01435 [Planctomycetes bacterium]|nr:hypothetical protein [Planctomycetota bacterium]
MRAFRDGARQETNAIQESNEASAGCARGSCLPGRACCLAESRLALLIALKHKTTTEWGHGEVAEWSIAPAC